MDRADVPAPNPDAMSEKGSTTGISSAGLIETQDYNYQLTGRGRVDIYNQMRLGDATVRATMLALTLPLLSADWRVEAGGNSRMAKKAAEFINDSLIESDELTEGMSRSWQEVLGEILLYLTYGSMAFEKVFYFRDDGLVGLKKLAMRHPSSIFKWVLEDGKPGIVQQTITKGKIEIPISKLVVFVNQKEGDNWEGISLLRSAYKHWYTKDKYYLIDAIATERQGVGIPVAEKPQTGANAADEAKIKELLRNLRANHAANIVIPYGWKVGMMDMKGNQIKNPIAMVQHHDRQISKNILAQFIELGANAVGSYSLSRDQSSFFLMALESVAKYIAMTMTKYVISDLVRYNFMLDPKEYPKLRYGKIGKVDANTITTALQRAQQTGFITPQPEDEAFLREIMDLPEITGKIADPSLVQDMLDEIDAEVATLDDSAVDTAPAEQMPAMDQVASDFYTMTASDFVDNYGANVHNILKAGKPGVPLSDETKQKISEALKKYHSSGGKGGKGKKGKKSAYSSDPEYQKARKEASKLQKEARKINEGIRREMLEMKAKGEKLSPEDLAKKQLDILNQKSALSDKIQTLRDKMDAIKEKYSSQSKPAEPQPKAHEHDATPTPAVLLKMSEQVSEAINELKTAKS